MKTARTSIIAIVVLALAASACSKGPSLKDYYAELETVQTQMQNKVQASQDGLAQQMQAAKTDAEQLVLFKQLVLADVAAVSAAAEVLGKIDPPSEVKEAHDKFVAAINASTAALKEAMDAFDTYKTMAEAQQALSTEAIQATGKGIDAACVPLQKIADDNGIKITLSCASTAGSSSPAPQAPPPPAALPSPTYGP